MLSMLICERFVYYTLQSKNLLLNARMHFLNGTVSLPFFRHVRRGETTKKGCVIRSIFQVPTTHVSVVLTNENEKGIGDFKT